MRSGLFGGRDEDELKGLASYYPGKFRVLAPFKKLSKKEKRDYFQQYAQAVHDNLAAYPGQKGYVLDFDGGLYEIDRSKRSARRMAENEGEEIRQKFWDAR